MVIKIYNLLSPAFKLRKDIIMRKHHSKIKLLIIAILGVIILIFMSFYISIFFIGNAVSEGLHFEEVSVSDDTVSLIGETGGSADSYKGFEYEIKDDCLYVKIKYVMVSEFSKNGMNFSVMIHDDFRNIRKLYLLNDENEKNLIWSKEFGNYKCPKRYPAT